MQFVTVDPAAVFDPGEMLWGPVCGVMLQL